MSTPDEQNWRVRMSQASADYMAGRITLDEYWALRQQDSRRLREVLQAVARWRITQRRKRQEQDR